MHFDVHLAIKQSIHMFVSLDLKKSGSFIVVSEEKNVQHSSQFVLDLGRNAKRFYFLSLPKGQKNARLFVVEFSSSTFRNFGRSSTVNTRLFLGEFSPVECCWKKVEFNKT